VRHQPRTRGISSAPGRAILARPLGRAGSPADGTETSPGKWPAGPDPGTTLGRSIPRRSSCLCSLPRSRCPDDHHHGANPLGCPVDPVRAAAKAILAPAGTLQRKVSQLAWLAIPAACSWSSKCACESSPRKGSCNVRTLGTWWRARSRVRARADRAGGRAGLAHSSAHAAKQIATAGMSNYGMLVSPRWPRDCVRAASIRS